MNDTVKQLARNLLTPHPEVDARIEHGIELHRKGTASFTVADAKGAKVPGAEVTFTLKRHDFDFGCNAFVYRQFEGVGENEAYEALFTDVFNLAVIPFYWSDLEVEPGKPRFTKDSPFVYRRPPVDALLEFCESHGITPKGHPLVWHSFVPNWLDADDPLLANRWERRVREIAERYGDRIQNWDVVNEVVDNGFRDHPKVPGPSHAHFAFDIAQRHLPQSCRLNYNDYAVWGALRDRYTPATMLVENLMRTGHRVGGFGLQYHMFERDLDAMLANYPATMLNQEHLVDCLDTHASLGVPLNISEITVTAREDLGNDNLAFQAYAIERLYRLWFSHPAVNGIIYWNLVDDTAYSPAGSLWNENFFKGGLVTRAFKPKPAYQAVRNLVRDEWTTRETVTFDPQKPCYLRGFYGTYDVKIKLPDGRVETATARLVKDRKNRFAFTV